MSKQTLSFALTALIVLAAGIYYAFPFTQETTQSHALHSDTSSIMLYVEGGDVSYKTADMETFQKATTSPVIISNNTHVHTGLGRATILFPNNGSVALDHYTELLVTYDGSHTSLLQTLGTTYHRVEALIGGATYEVETPGTLAAVRGTKFAVKYDKKLKTTKIAVTEHQVEVSKLKSDAASTTQETVERVTLREGSTARVSFQSTTDAKINVVETKTDVDMNVWVEANLQLDTTIDGIRNDTSKTKEDIRAGIKELLIHDSSTIETKTSREENTRTTTQEKDRETKPAVSDQNPSTKDEYVSPTPAPTPVVRLLSEEAFFDKFNNLFASYFYLDEQDSACEVHMTPSERVRVVTSFASESGYPFASKTLLDLATAVDMYCQKKDPSVKLKLQARFDTEFPFQDAI